MVMSTSVVWASPNDVLFVKLKTGVAGNNSDGSLGVTNQWDALPITNQLWIVNV